MSPPAKTPARKGRPSPAERREKLRHDSRVAEYLRHRNALGERMLRATMRALATAEAAGMVNSILEQKFGMESAGIVVSEVQSYAVSILRAEIMHALSSEARIDPATKRRLARRFVARLLPTRDNQSSSPLTPKRAANFDLESALEGIIKRDMQKSYGKGSTR